MEVKRLGIIGTGLIGASVGLAAKRAGVEVVEGYDFSEAVREAALGRGAAVDEESHPRHAPVTDTRHLRR